MIYPCAKCHCNSPASTQSLSAKSTVASLLWFSDAKKTPYSYPSISVSYTHLLVETERNKYKKGILHDIESFAKRTQLRNVSKAVHLSQNEVSNIYDIYYQSIDSYRISMGTGSSKMDFTSFVQFLAKICDWCKSSSSDLDHRFRKQRNDFLKRLFKSWDKGNFGELTLNDVVSGLDKMKTEDIMESMNNFFQLYDDQQTGKIQREQILKMSEDLLFLTEPWKSGRCIDLLTQTSIENDIAESIVKKNGGRVVTLEEIELPKGVVIDDEKYKAEQSERYLHAASNFLQRCFEYAQPLEQEVPIDLLDLSDDTDNEEKKKNNEKRWNSLKANVALNPNTPCTLDLATFRMLVLADETYEQFFANTLRNSIHVDEQVNALESRSKALRNVFDGLIADGRRVANQVRRRVDSVATQQSESPSQDKQIDLDDFSTDHGDESMELLHSDYRDLMDMDDDEMHSDHKKLNSFDLDQSTHPDNHQGKKDLIEFET